MKVQFDILLQTRKRFVQLLDGLSLAAINTIPEGYNNNVLWNFAHAIVTQQRLTYGLADVPFTIDAGIVAKYARDTKPDGQATQAEVDALKRLAFESLERLEQDYAAGAFAGFKPYLTGYGVQLDSIADAIAFLPVHEGLHLGYAMALKRRLS